jgi:hypothetical protein
MLPRHGGIASARGQVLTYLIVAAIRSAAATGSSCPIPDHCCGPGRHELSQERSQRSSMPNTCRNQGPRLSTACGYSSQRTLESGQPGRLQNGSSPKGGRGAGRGRGSRPQPPPRTGCRPTSGWNARWACFPVADLRGDFLWAVLCAVMCVALPGRRLTVGPRQSGQALMGSRPGRLERGRAPP